MIKPKISIILSAIRTKLWKDFCKSLLSNKITYEIIFVGNKSPFPEYYEDFKKLGDKNKIYHIYSNKMPAECYQIGFEFATGELINWTSDDVEYSEGALDIAYEDYKKLNNDKIVIAFNCIENGSPTSLGHHIMDQYSPQMAPIGMVNRELLLKLGGYDKNFICGQAENDLVMRIYEISGSLYLSSALVYIEHNKKHEGKSIFRTEDGFPYHKQDRTFLESCWVKPDGTISQTRLKTFKPFIKEKR